MLIADVSSTVENLALLVNKKANELAKLQREYEEKLEIINAYIGKIAQRPESEKLEKSQELEISKNSREIPENELLKLISTPVCCPLCLNTLYDLSSTSEFVLVPRNKAHLLRDFDDTVNKVQTSVENLQVSEQPAKKHGKLKKTCSYCKKPGHSRARCFTRLSKDPSEPQSSENHPGVDTALPDTAR